jgi:hypothetical protein
VGRRTARVNIAPPGLELNARHGTLGKHNTIWRTPNWIRQSVSVFGPSGSERCTTRLAPAIALCASTESGVTGRRVTPWSYPALISSAFFEYPSA